MSHHFEREVLERLRRLEFKVDRLTHLVKKCCCKKERPTGVEIIQLTGGTMSITGINVGGSGTFEADPVPSTSTFPAGTVNTWTADDPSITITPANPADPEDTQVIVTVPSTDTNTSFNLTVSAQMPPATPGGTPPAALTNTVSVPIIPAPPQPPTGVVINQVA